MNLESKSHQLKEIIGSYNSDWLLGFLFSLIHAGRESATEQLKNLSSPLRQLYYIAGLNISSDPSQSKYMSYDPKKWNQIVSLLNEIEFEYHQFFFQNIPGKDTKELNRIKHVCIQSFLSYFNQGPLNYEEQILNWIDDLFVNFDNLILSAVGLRTNDFIIFYKNLDLLKRNNLNAHLGLNTLRPNWDSYSKIRIGVVDGTSEYTKKMADEYLPLATYTADHGIIDRFYADEIVSENLSIEKIEIILNLLTVQRENTNFLYFTSNNPIYERPILDLGNGVFQVFHVKQVAHAISKLLEKACTALEVNKIKYIERKGKLLESKIVSIFSNFFKNEIKIYTNYFVDGNEHDILIIWKKYVLIIEAKGFKIREPLRDPEKAFIRINDDFKTCIGYGYEQTRRIEKKFIDGSPIRITDKNGRLVEIIDTTQFEQDFSIIVNIESFGQIQCDLSTLIKLEKDDDVYPWVVKIDDLEVFLLTMIAQKKNPKKFITFLLMRESLHGKLICSDELEICGGFLVGKLNQKQIDKSNIVVTTPDLEDVFEKQYLSKMGFKNELHLDVKQSDDTFFF